MVNEQVDLDFEFSNEELANFLENFAGKLRDGEVGLSFKGRQEVNIEPTQDNKVDMNFFESSDNKRLDLRITLKEQIETTDEGRRKLKVEIV
jgi:amphi-Trp domain-containing protein